MGKSLPPPWQVAGFFNGGTNRLGAKQNSGELSKSTNRGMSLRDYGLPPPWAAQGLLNEEEAGFQRSEARFKPISGHAMRGMRSGPGTAKRMLLVLLVLVVVAAVVGVARSPLSVSLFLCFSVSLSLCFSLALSLCLFLSLYLSILVSLYIPLSLYLPISQSLSSLNPPIYLSLSLSLSWPILHVCLLHMAYAWREKSDDTAACLASNHQKGGLWHNTSRETWKSAGGGGV